MRPDPVPTVSHPSESLLADLPLRPEEELSATSASPRPERAKRVAREAAGLSVRAGAFGADAAMVLLLGIASILVAQGLTGDLPFSAGLPWIGAFLVLLSFFATVPPLILFGKTVGMALAGLAVGAGAGGLRLLRGEAVRRWLGTFTVIATLGLALLFTAASSNAPTPADRWSGRSLIEDEAEN